jgi:hypothetical protein
MKIIKWLFFWRKPKPMTITIGTMHHHTSKLLESADNIAYWFSENKDKCTQEIATQLDNSLSRIQALQSAILIKIREDNEAAQIKRFKESHEKRQARIKEQSEND